MTALQLKSYSCNLPDGGLLSGLVVPGSLLVQCHTGLSSNQTLADGSNATSPAPESSPAPATGRRLLQTAATAASNGSYCDVGFKVASPAAIVQCRATQCTMGANSPVAQCEVASCSCPGGCGDREWQCSLSGCTNRTRLLTRPKHFCFGPLPCRYILLA